MIRKIIHIDEVKCDGCELCIPNCPEGAIQIIEGKARLVSDMFCDGLGACLGHCPQGAITTEEREAEDYDERAVIEKIVRQGPAVVAAHLEHLRDHGELEYLKVAEDYLAEKGLTGGSPAKPEPKGFCGCPGSAERKIDRTPKSACTTTSVSGESSLTHWPVQLHLISPDSVHFKNCDLLIAADCVAFSFGSFHSRLLDGKKLTIFCPKLDQGLDIYREKVLALIDRAKVNTLTVAIMEVPCCRGLLQIVVDAARSASRRVPVKCMIIGVEGGILSDEWVSV
ncbi:MAG: 4Fe-4S ferredoxin [Bdellovibrionales bacterium GWB1_55_8]|nr:MAG: 4Fe-4S ferredoxin [Bdellovibrionales bacterium GWB1_55_8]